MEFLFGFFPILPDILAELFLLSFSGNLIFDLLLLAFLDELLGHQFWVTELGSNLRILLALPASLLKVLRVVAHDILDFFLGQFMFQTRLQALQIFLFIQFPHLSKYR